MSDRLQKEISKDERLWDRKIACFVGFGVFAWYAAVVWVTSLTPSLNFTERAIYSGISFVCAMFFLSRVFRASKNIDKARKFADSMLVGSTWMVYDGKNVVQGVFGWAQSGLDCMTLALKDGTTIETPIDHAVPVGHKTYVSGQFWIMSVDQMRKEAFERQSRASAAFVVYAVTSVVMAAFTVAAFVWAKYLFGASALMSIAAFHMATIKRYDATDVFENDIAFINVSDLIAAVAETTEPMDTLVPAVDPLKREVDRRSSGTMRLVTHLVCIAISFGCMGAAVHVTMSGEPTLANFAIGMGYAIAAIGIQFLGAMITKSMDLPSSQFTGNQWKTPSGATGAVEKVVSGGSYVFLKFPTGGVEAYPLSTLSRGEAVAA